jgi:hypothetical protein
MIYTYNKSEVINSIKVKSHEEKATRTDLRVNLVTVKLNDDELDILNKLAKQHFVGKSTVFRQLLSGNIVIEKK